MACYLGAGTMWKRPDNGPFDWEPGNGGLSGHWSEAEVPRIKVGQPVTQLPPHKSQRAELPHWAFQNCSLRTRFFSYS